MAYFLSLTPPEDSIVLTRGQTYEDTWVFSVNGVPFDFTDATITAKVATNVDGSGVALATFAQFATLNTTGTMSLRITAAGTAAIAIPADAANKQIRPLGFLIVECTYADTTVDQLLRGRVSLNVLDAV